MTGRAIIIDDEQNAIDIIISLLQETALDLEIIGSANSFDAAVKLCLDLKPDLLFLDIHLDKNTGFELARKIYESGLRPYIIFVTAYDKHAIDAFKQNALGYLLKPVGKDDLLRVVKRFFVQAEKDTFYHRIHEYLGKKKHLRFNTRGGFIVLDPEKIIYFEASGSYTIIYLTKNSRETVSMNLGTIENQLDTGDFTRISKSHIINYSYLYKIDRIKQLCTLSVEGTNIQLKASKKRLKTLSDKYLSPDLP